MRNIATTFLLGTIIFSFGNITNAQTLEVSLPAKDENDGGWTTLVPAGCLGPDASKTENCGFPEFMQLVANIMGLLTVLALAIATFLFAFAGFKYATAVGNPSQIQGAKKIFTNVIIGLVIVFIAYTIVQVIASSLQVEPEYNQFLDK